jgi:hypothetical protein
VSGVLVRRKLKLVINQNYIEMHGQQNIKFWSFILDSELG